MENLKVHHIGYLVKKIDKAIVTFQNLGYVKETEIIYDEYRGIDICFMIKDGYRIELVSPLAKDSVVYGLMKKMGNSPYHICYECNSIGTSVEELRARGYVKLDEPHEAVAFDKKNVCFMVHPYLGMIELLEVND